MRRVLHDAVRVDEVERVVGKRQTLAVGDAQDRPSGPAARSSPSPDAIADCVRSTPVTIGAALRESREIHARAAADFEHRSAAIAVEVHEPQQVMQLFEVILIEIVEEAARADRMPRDLEIVNVLFPVRANVIDRRHSGHYTIRSSESCMTRDIGARPRRPSTCSSSAAASTA